MNDWVLKADGLGKAYHLRQPRRMTHVALEGVSFELAPGEALGVGGPNGGGKSTLLRVLAGLLVPDSGSLEHRGVRQCIIELGGSFQSEFSGEDNAAHLWALSGWRSGAIAQGLREVAEFSGLGEQLKEPVRSYSAGMLIRLAFSAATQQRPDILLLDEVLSVGDLSFQKRCLERLQGFRQQGTALVFATQSLEHLASMADRVMLLEGGRPQFLGEPAEACRRLQQKAL